MIWQLRYLKSKISHLRELRHKRWFPCGIISWKGLWWNLSTTCPPTERPRLRSSASSWYPELAPSLKLSWSSLFGAASNLRWSPVVREMLAIEPTVVMVIKDTVVVKICCIWPPALGGGVIGQPHDPDVATGCFHKALWCAKLVASIRIQKGKGVSPGGIHCHKIVKAGVVP